MSSIVRSSIIFALLVTAAHAQTSSPYARDNSSPQGRLLQQPATRASGYGHEYQSTTQQPSSIQPASHTTAQNNSKYDEPMPLLGNADSQRLAPGSGIKTNGKKATTTVIGSLTVVLAAFFVLVWLSRKTAPKGLAPLPGEVFESLGRAPLTARQQMQLIRLGNKLVLLSITPSGAETLTEITDVDEVNRLTGLCQQTGATSISASFRQVLSQYADEPAPGGFIGDPSASQVEIANRTTRRDRRREGGRG